MNSRLCKIIVGVGLITVFLFYINFNILNRSCRPSRELLAASQIDLDSEKTKESEGSELEFPRLYEIPPCNPQINTTVPVSVCKNLHDKMAEETRQTYLRLLKYFDELATSRNWTWFIVAGTLLGSWRHHDIIIWDDDLDIMVDLKHRKDIVNTIEKQKRFVPKQCVGSKIRLYDRKYIEGTYYWEGVGRWFYPSIDLFFFNRNSTHVYRVENDSGTLNFVLGDLFPLHKRPLSTMMVPAPKDSLLHLIKNYRATSRCIYRDGVDNGKPECLHFHPYLPFVHRKWVNDRMGESLILNGKVLHVKYIDEMKENLPLHPYTLASERFKGPIFRDRN